MDFLWFGRDPLPAATGRGNSRNPTIHKHARWQATFEHHRTSLLENASKMTLIPVSHGIYQDFQSFFLRRRATTLVAILPKQPQAGLVSETGDSVVAQKMSSKCNYHNCRLHLSQLDAFASFATILHHSYPFLTSNLEQLHHHSLLITRRLLDTRHCCSGQRSAKGPRHHRLWCLAFNSVGWCRVSRAWMGIASRWPYVYIIIKAFVKVDLKRQEHLTGQFLAESHCLETFGHVCSKNALDPLNSLQKMW